MAKDKMLFNYWTCLSEVPFPMYPWQQDHRSEMGAFPPASEVRRVSLNVPPPQVWEVAPVGSLVASSRSNRSKALEEGAFLVPSRRLPGASLATHLGRTKVSASLEVGSGQGEASLASSRRAKEEDCLGTLEEGCSARPANRRASGDSGDRHRWVWLFYQHTLRHGEAELISS